jgi:hypothetical protein
MTASSGHLRRQAEVVHGHDVRVVEERRDARLPQELREHLPVAEQLGPQVLDGDVAQEIVIPRALDAAHPALSEQPDVLVPRAGRPRPWQTPTRAVASPRSRVRCSASTRRSRARWWCLVAPS